MGFGQLGGQIVPLGLKLGLWPGGLRPPLPTARARGVKLGPQAVDLGLEFGRPLG
jgi:hypothetical protein